MAEVEIVEPSAGSMAESSLVARDALSPHGRPCSACGCPVEPNDRFCPACGTRFDDVVTATVVADAPTQKFFRCASCGSEMAADPDQRTYACPFCDATYVVEFSPEISPRQRPEFVIGFAVTREQAQAKFTQWIRKNSWFRPGDLSSATMADKQRGVYLPFWSFSMLAQSSWSATIGEHWYRTETYTETDSKGHTVTKTRQVQETEWWPLGGRHHRYYSGFLISGSRGLPQNVAEWIMPFNMPAMKRYAPYFLAGWLAEEYSVARDDAMRVCMTEFQRRENQNVAAFLPGDTQRSLQVSTNFSQVNSDLCLLPVHLLSYRYRNKLYRFLVNGQTGKCEGDKPVSWARIMLAIGGGLFLVAIVVIVIAILSR